MTQTKTLNRRYTVRKSSGHTFQGKRHDTWYIYDNKLKTTASAECLVKEYVEELAHEWNSKHAERTRDE